MAKKLFISYSRIDKGVAERVANALQVQGYDVLWDREIPAGQKFDSYILSQLGQSEGVVVLWSKDSVRSDYVKEEADYGKTQSVLVPLRIDETMLPFGFTRIHTTDLLTWDGSIDHPEWRRVLHAIEVSLNNGESVGIDPMLPEITRSDAETASPRSKAARTADPVAPLPSGSTAFALGVVLLLFISIVLFALRLV